ncbi:MAG: IS6 family transposase [Candidatus Bathyarchaeia archaeon]
MKQREFNRRELRGLAIIAKGGMIRKLCEDAYLVRSSDLERWYRVSWDGKDWVCECDDFVKHKRPCKHVYAILFFNRLPFILMANFQAEVVKCPRCGSDRIIRKGLIHNKSFSSQRYMCKNCKHKFTDKREHKGLKGNPLAMVIATDLFFKGLSLRSIDDHFKRVYALDIPYPTIHRWIKRYIQQLKMFEKRLHLPVGERWHMDDTVIKISGQPRYLWNVIDGKTRILLASVLTCGRGVKEAEIALREALKNAGTKPKEIVTDGLKSYQLAIKNIFDDEVTHISKVRFTDPENNNLVERLNGTLKGRIEGFRKLSSESSARGLLEGWRLFYNIARPHRSLRGLSPVDNAFLSKNGPSEV